MMEVEGALRKFQRSESKNKLRYTKVCTYNSNLCKVFILFMYFYICIYLFNYLSIFPEAQHFCYNYYLDYITLFLLLR